MQEYPTDWTLVWVFGTALVLAFIIPLFWGILWGKRHVITDAESRALKEPPSLILRQNGDIDIII
jgi:hypothetical protein